MLSGPARPAYVAAGLLFTNPSQLIGFNQALAFIWRAWLRWDTTRDQAPAVAQELDMLAAIAGFLIVLVATFDEWLDKRAGANRD